MGMKDWLLRTFSTDSAVRVPVWKFLLKKYQNIPLYCIQQCLCINIECYILKFISNHFQKSIVCNFIVKALTSNFTAWYPEFSVSSIFNSSWTFFFNKKNSKSVFHIFNLKVAVSLKNSCNF